jgi:hypothetical protein
MDRAIDGVAHFLRLDESLGGIDVAQLVQDAGLLRILGIEIVANGFAAAGDQMVLGRVDRDSIEPGVKGAIAAERRCRPIRLQKRLLRHVQGFGRIANVSHDELDDLVLVFDDQQIERRSVALLHASNQRKVRGAAAGRVSVGLLCQTLLGRPHASPKVRPAFAKVMNAPRDRIVD